MTELENSNQINNYSIITGGRVNLVLTSDDNFVVFVKIADEVYTPIYFKETDNIDDIKIKIRKREEIPLKDEKILFNRKEIENNKTLKEIGVTVSNNIIYLDLKS